MYSAQTETSQLSQNLVKYCLRCKQVQVQVLELIFYVFAFPFCISYLSSCFNGESLCLCLALFNSTLTFQLWLYNSNLFKNLLYYMSFNDHLLKRDKTYQIDFEKSCKNLAKSLIIHIFMYIVFMCISGMVWYIKRKVILTLYFVIVKVITMMFWNKRYFMEFFYHLRIF